MIDSFLGPDKLMNYYCHSIAICRFATVLAVEQPGRGTGCVLVFAKNLIQIQKRVGHYGPRGQVGGGQITIDG